MTGCFLVEKNILNIIKYIVIVVLMAISLGYFYYYNFPLERDEMLERHMNLMMAENNIKKPKYIYELFPGDWDRVCVFTHEYTDIDDIKNSIGIDVSYTRARVWVGSEVDGTVLFIKNNTVLNAQKIYVGNIFAKPEGSNKNLWCGNRNTTIIVNIKNINIKNYRYQIREFIISLK